MSTTVDLAQGAELCVGGATVGVFLAKANLRELKAERESLRKEVEELRRELAAVWSERDQYAKSLLAAMWELDPIDPATAEALIAEAEKDGVDFEEVMRQVEEVLERKGGQAPVLTEAVEPVFVVEGAADLPSDVVRRG